MQAQLLTATPILEVFVHEDEADEPRRARARLFENRSRKHARNAYWMLFEPEQLSQRAARASAKDSVTRDPSTTTNRRDWARFTMLARVTLG